MEAPFTATSWDGITGPIFAGYGSAEWPWIAVSLLCVVVAVVGGWRHEKHAYDAAKNGKH